jgi:hypothetical protein
MADSLDSCRAKIARAEEVWNDLGADLVEFLERFLERS